MQHLNLHGNIKREKIKYYKLRNHYKCKSFTVTICYTNIWRNKHKERKNYAYDSANKDLTNVLYILKRRTK